MKILHTRSNPSGQISLSRDLIRVYEASIAAGAAQACQDTEVLLAADKCIDADLLYQEGLSRAPQAPGAVYWWNEATAHILYAQGYRAGYLHHLRNTDEFGEEFVQECYENAWADRQPIGQEMAGQETQEQQVAQ